MSHMMERYRPRRRSVAVWDPFQDMEEMARMMDANFGRPLMWRRLPGEDYLWSPSIEMYEKDNHYILRMEIPGVNPEGVDISLSGTNLTVKGERKGPEDIRDKAYQLCEMCYGSFSRSITLPEPVDSANITATFENGILDIRIPKAEEAKPRQIKIQGASHRPKLARSESKPGTSRAGSQIKGSESVADSARSISPSEQQAKSKIPYEG
jgi:HSP20 family protein